MPNLLHRRITPVALVLDGRAGLTLFAPGDESFDEGDAFLGGESDIAVFASASQMHAFIVEQGDASLEGHPQWQGVLRSEPRALRAAAHDTVDFNAVFGAVGEPLSPEAVAVVQTCVMTARTIAEICDDQELLSFLDGNSAYQSAEAGFGYFSGRWGQRGWNALGGEVVNSWGWVLQCVDRHLTWHGNFDRNDLDAIVDTNVRYPAGGPAAAHFVPASILRRGASDEGSSAVWPDPTVLLPSRTGTVVLTLLFGVLGAFAAVGATKRARLLGVRTGRYWSAFWVALLAPCLFWIVVVVVLVSAVGNSSGGDLN